MGDKDLSVKQPLIIAQSSVLKTFTRLHFKPLLEDTADTNSLEYLAATSGLHFSNVQKKSRQPGFKVNLIHHATTTNTKGAAGESRRRNYLQAQISQGHYLR
jgi:hypothetical protein